MKTETWVKIILGWLMAVLIGAAGWMLRVHDSFASRPTDKVVDARIEKVKKASAEKSKANSAALAKQSEDIRRLQVNEATLIQIQKSQAETVGSHGDKLDNMQADIKKILWRTQPDGDD